MPAWVVLRMVSRLRHLPEIIFDADGLPIQERLDFAGMKVGGLMHRLLKGIEDRILEKADKVLVRSNRATAIHLEGNARLWARKFYKVINGRPELLFFSSSSTRSATRVRLGFGEDELLLVHAGSLGGGYETERMFELLQSLDEYGLPARLLLMSRNEEKAHAMVPMSLKSIVSVISCEFEAVPEILRAADIGICLRKKAKSIAGIAPIKLGEYLMCGLPVVFSQGIGDLDEMLSGLPFALRIDGEYSAQGFLRWARRIPQMERSEIAEFGRRYFSLESSLESYTKALKEGWN
ncbi:hypothetical protein GCM10027454_09770 [Algoriphagus aestuariicola]